MVVERMAVVIRRRDNVDRPMMRMMMMAMSVIIVRLGKVALDEHIVLYCVSRGALNLFHRSKIALAPILYFSNARVTLVHNSIL